jgi:hypothetical protein
MVIDNEPGTVVQSLDVGVGGEILSYFKQSYDFLTRQIPETMSQISRDNLHQATADSPVTQGPRILRKPPYFQISTHTGMGSNAESSLPSIA